MTPGLVRAFRNFGAKLKGVKDPQAGETIRILKQAHS
jgi:hypothetical protein